MHLRPGMCIISPRNRLQSAAIGAINVPELTKPILIDAIVGRGFISMDEAEHYTRVGLARFTGNQHNAEWQWERRKLEALTFELLLSIYQQRKP